VSGIESMVEDVGVVNLALSEAARQDSRTAHLLKRSLRRSTSGDEVDIGAALKHGEPQEPATEANVVVLASGNLGLISFLDWKERMTYEQIVDAFPGLVQGLVQHEGIAFLMVHSNVDGGLVLGPGGIRYLDHGYAVGTDPLLPFGQQAAQHLKRTDSFSNAPDILVNSMFDPATGEVAAFEELVGCHGGLGGPQTQPFLLYPSAFPPPEGALIGTAALHRTLKGWQAATREPPSAIPDEAVPIMQQPAYPFNERSDRHVGTDAE
jgi:hypothetical protein